ncbi:heme-degrading domain-containing protein [Microbacterium sp. M3]|uniref:Heme-degrading domain-containing protein n=1 Tax=Microbacterium arthrosphaerae TaxID=792652 RepID=A0ABU4H753_9MICO|nr:MULTISPECIES: heme-degrading domain-containing protein [Microbacterium]MDW4574484.1 heme-degrading domain-containing protein [Microbacterium arthrosphaerae]MDW7608339.1 heme-degrading domain-containing protein [Microbacterium sp. M3]
MPDDIAAQLARVEADEAEVVLTRFDVTDAWALGRRMRKAAAARGLPIVIGITLGEARVFHTALPGSSADNDGWLERKTRVARRYGRSSFGVGLSFRAAGKDFDTDGRLDPAQYAAHGGVFPLTIAGVGMVGTVGVSGLPQADDHAFVVEHLRAWRDEAQRSDGS